MAKRKRTNELGLGHVGQLLPLRGLLGADAEIGQLWSALAGLQSRVAIALASVALLRLRHHLEQPARVPLGAHPITP